MNNLFNINDISLSEEIDWSYWMSSWDEQQTGYLEKREERFQVMLDVLEELLPAEFIALDLCCGPGSISQRLLARFPQARCIAIDIDPLLMAIGKAVLGDFNGRLKWVEVDLLDVSYLAEKIGVEKIDAVLSTTALHWLPVENLLLVYRHLGELIRPDGVFLNGDNINFSSTLAAFNKISSGARERHERISFTEMGVQDWDQWFEALIALPGIEPLYKERKRRFEWRPKGFTAPIIDVHLAGLVDGGFRQVGIIWQHFDDRIIMAVR